MENVEKRILFEDLKCFCIKAMEKYGMGFEDAQITADVLVSTDAFGTHSHGTKNLKKYMEKVKAGGIDPKAVPEVASEGPGWAVMDGHNAIGMVSSYKAMEKAISKAKSSGIGYVGLKNGCHFGAAGYYANMAVKENMIGLAMSNADPNMTVPGGKGIILGNNPFAYAAPAGKELPVFLDIAMSSVAYLKVNKAKAQGIPVPEGWLVDIDGVPTTDAGKFPTEAFLSPMAGHKGYGMALLVEILAAVITGAGITKEVKSWDRDLPASNNSGQAFIALNIDSFIPLQYFKDRMDGLICEMRESPKAKNSNGVYLPGQIEWEKWEKACKTGINLPEDVFTSLEGLAKDIDLEINFIK